MPRHPETKISRDLRDYLICKLRLAGHTRKAIAEFAICSPNVVSNTLRKFGRSYKDRGIWRWYSLNSVLERIGIDEALVREVGAERMNRTCHSAMTCRLPAR